MPRTPIDLGRVLGRPARARGTRVMLISTPRSGNTWVRRLLTTAYRADESPRGESWAHSPDELPWDEFPLTSVVQIHWCPEPAFRRQIRARGFRVVTVVRHPLDTLISILQMCQGTRETERWLNGVGGDESPIWSASPTSQAFLDYATGPRARALLALNLEWAATPGTLLVRYESLVDDPFSGLTTLTRKLGRVQDVDVRRAVESNTIERLRASHNAIHFWQGKPGQWKRLLPGETARRIASAHWKSFQAFGYACDPDPSLGSDEAEANWRSLTTDRAV
ncbi:MAG: sulfotransferase [Isosphaeraceae bacterium]